MANSANYNMFVFVRVCFSDRYAEGLSPLCPAGNADSSTRCRNKVYTAVLNINKYRNAGLFIRQEKLNLQ